MLKSQIVPAPACAGPTITFPFLWLSKSTGRVYLRTAAMSPSCGHSSYRGHDIKLVIGTDDRNEYETGTAVDNTGVYDQAAWDQRLPADQAVTLRNVV